VPNLADIQIDLIPNLTAVADLFEGLAKR